MESDCNADGLYLAKPIGTVHSDRFLVGDDNWGTVESTIELDPTQFSPEAILGLTDFSHIEVIYHFHLVSPEQVETAARHPRNRKDWPAVGIFAQRGKNRPNRLGVSRCRLVDVSGTTIRVLGLDAIDGTPILDIKPYMREFGPIGDVQQPQWATELMQHYYDP